MMNDVIELRQYTLHPQRRETLIDLFDREFVETQEAVGMAVLGQFRDLDDPDRFVWLRGFADMPSRAEALGRFYGGPVWKAHRDQANATMIDSDNVLLLRPARARPVRARPVRARPARTRPTRAQPARAHYGFPAATRHPVGHTTPPPSLVLATLYYQDQPFDETFVDFFDSQMRPALVETGATPLACFQTEHAENAFPALPVRTGENVFVWFARFPSQARLSDHLHQVERSGLWQGQPQHLRLSPTTRSLLR